MTERTATSTPLAFLSCSKPSSPAILATRAATLTFDGLVEVLLRRSDGVTRALLPRLHRWSAARCAARRNSIVVDSSKGHRRTTSAYSKRVWGTNGPATYFVCQLHTRVQVALAPAPRAREFTHLRGVRRFRQSAIRRQKQWRGGKPLFAASTSGRASRLSDRQTEPWRPHAAACSWRPVPPRSEACRHTRRRSAS